MPSMQNEGALTRRAAVPQTCRGRAQAGPRLRHPRVLLPSLAGRSTRATRSQAASPRVSAPTETTASVATTTATTTLVAATTAAALTVVPTGAATPCLPLPLGPRPATSRAAAARSTATEGRARAAQPWQPLPRPPLRLRRHADLPPSGRTGAPREAEGSIPRRPRHLTTRLAVAVLPFLPPGEELARRAAVFPEAAARAAHSSGRLRRRRPPRANRKVALRGMEAGTTTITVGAARLGAAQVEEAGQWGAALTRQQVWGQAAIRAVWPTARSAVATIPGTGTREEVVSAGTNGEAFLEEGCPEAVVYLSKDLSEHAVGIMRAYGQVPRLVEEQVSSLS